MPILPQPATISTPASTSRETVVTQGSAEITIRDLLGAGLSEVTSTILLFQALGTDVSGERKVSEGNLITGWISVE
ncbi:hypothetical protein GCM10022252_13910 [Streptosporangium oxazolinicum]|uniref:Uncharacterized protein n=1 Tax=Streptosporangium oxazolinicum TaxID=909287 RepID=A0ABP8AIW2_9ACTN